MTGPIAADTLFVRAMAGEFDAVVAMYHDQGHVALKTIGFDRAVNVTLGLPIVRTSVAHGTAYDIAWRGRRRDLEPDRGRPRRRPARRSAVASSASTWPSPDPDFPVRALRSAADDLDFDPVRHDRLGPDRADLGVGPAPVGVGLRMARIRCRPGGIGVSTGKGPTRPTSTAFSSAAQV